MTYTDLPFDSQDAAKLLADAANGADDGDIYVQRSRSEGFVFDDGRLKSATYDTSQGFGLRVVAGEASGNAHSGELTLDAIRRASDTAKQAKRGYTGSLAVSPTPTNRQLYANQSIRQNRQILPSKRVYSPKSMLGSGQKIRGSFRFLCLWLAVTSKSIFCAPQAKPFTIFGLWCD